MPAALPVSEQIVHVQSEDGYMLAGLSVTPVAWRKETLIIWLHGLNLGFCEPEYVRIGRLVAERGAAFISAETRGHGFGSWLRGPSGTKLAGSAWEMLAEAPADITAWLQHARETGARQVIFAGHGWGAAKIVYYIAERGSSGIDAIVVASSGSLVRDNTDPTQVDLAEALVREGRGLDLLPWGTRKGVAPATVSAQVYAARARVQRELYGRGEMRPALSRVDVPILAWFGDRETTQDRDVSAFLDTIRRNATAAPQVETRVLRGASYLYTGAEHVVAATLAGWADGLSAPQKAIGTGGN
ncbi:MAG: alpha/beta hydrolase [Paracoccaceae bacterium]